MPSSKKDLYIAKSMSGLNDFSKLPAKMTTNNPKILLKTADKMLKEADVAHSLSDEERAYVLYMKYFNVVQLIKKTAEYKKQKDYYDSMLGQKNLMKAIDRAEELSGSLKDRYDLIEAEQVAEKLASLDRSSSDTAEKEDKKEKKSGDEKKSSIDEKKKGNEESDEKEEAPEPVKPPSKVSPTELYILLQDKETKLAIMDVRPEQQFKESHIQHDNCINIPAEIIPPGTTVTYIKKALPDQSKSLWHHRGTMDHIVLLDWNSTLDQCVPGTTLCTLKDALYKYDSSVIIKSEPLVLEGGYDQWLLYYPQLTTNAHVSRPEKTPVSSSSSTLDFDYPDFDEAFMTTPTPTPTQPALNNQSTATNVSHDPISQSMVVNDLFGPGKANVNGPSLPRVDRSTKPKPGMQSSVPASSEVEKSKSSSMYPSVNMLKEEKNLVTKPQNTDVRMSAGSSSGAAVSSSQLEKEREELEKLRRQKEEELLKFEKEKERIAQEHQAKLDKLVMEEKKLQEMKQDQTKDVANLMRMKKSLENDMKAEQSQEKAEQDFREKELARLQQEEIMKKRQAEVEKLRQDRKKREEEEEKVQRARDEAEKQAFLQARERARQEEERRKKELEEAEKKAELLRQQEVKAKEELERLKQEKIRQLEARQREEAERKRQEEQRKAELERKEQEIKKKEEEERLQRQKEDQERKERERKEKELQEKERAEQARREAEAKLKRLELSTETTKPKAIPSPNLPTGWEKRLDPNTRRYYYIDHNSSTTQWEPPSTPTASQSGTYTTKLKEEPTTPRRGLTRSNSSPNIAKMMADEEKAHSIPAFDRSSKPKPKVEIVQQPLVRPSPPRRALQRNLNPIYGNVGRALTGLRNLGNTCYMNSTIQCLNNTSPLVTYFLTDSYLYDINRESELGSHGEVADEFAVIVKALWSGQYRCITPRDFKFMVGKHQPMFAGYDQQDSQEFLTFLLDGLHEGLNRIKHRPKLPEQDNDNLPDSKAAEIAWKHHKLLNESIIVELFQGQLKSTLMCLTCRKQSVNFQAFMYLSLPIPSGSRCSLGDCIRLFLREEKMTGSSRWKCPRCKVERDSVKKIDIWKLPRILLIGLNRFVYEGQWRQKISSYVDFPVRNLDMNAYVKGPQYNLYGISNHFGTMDGGHYTAYCKNPNTQRWYKFDDDMVFDMSESDIKTSAAFVLYYTSVELKPPDFRQNFSAGS